MTAADEDGVVDEEEEEEEEDEDEGEEEELDREGTRTISPGDRGSIFEAQRRSNNPPFFTASLTRSGDGLTIGLILPSLNSS